MSGEACCDELKSEEAQPQHHNNKQSKSGGRGGLADRHSLQLGQQCLRPADTLHRIRILLLLPWLLFATDLQFLVLMLVKIAILVEDMRVEITGFMTAISLYCPASMVGRVPQPWEIQSSIRLQQL